MLEFLTIQTDEHNKTPLTPQELLEDLAPVKIIELPAQDEHSASLQCAVCLRSGIREYHGRDTAP
eukprot:3474789-Karenia_brevis.AAC.1